MLHTPATDSQLTFMWEYTFSSCTKKTEHSDHNVLPDLQQKESRNFYIFGYLEMFDKHWTNKKDDNQDLQQIMALMDDIAHQFPHHSHLHQQNHSH